MTKKKSGLDNVNIKSNTNLLKEIEKVLKNDWSAVLSKLEQQIIKILYLKKEPMNAHQIRKSFIFSTIYQLLKESLEKIDDYRRIPYKDIENLLHLKNYESFPFIPFSKIDINGFTEIMNKIFENYELFIEHLHASEQEINTKTLIEKLFGSITNSEKRFEKILGELNISLYNYKTIMDTLEELNSLNLIGKREIKVGKTNKVYFLNPTLKKYIK